MKDNKKVILKVGFPIFTFIAGTLVVLKVIGVADISWLLILGIWLAPLWLILALLLAFLAVIVAIATVGGIIIGGCFVSDWIYRKFKGY